MCHIDSYILLAFLFLYAGRSYSQGTSDSVGLSRFTLDGGIGYTFKTYYAAGISYHARGGVLALARVNWRAASFFGFSLEAGWMTVAAQSPEVFDAQRGGSKASMRIDAFPTTLQIFFTARWGELRAGAGAGIVKSTIYAWGERSSAERVNVMYLASYRYPIRLAGDWMLQPELAVFLIPNIDLIHFAPRMLCSYSL